MKLEQLVEKMVKASKEINKAGAVITFRQDAEAMLRIVLQAIQDGEVVDKDYGEGLNEVTIILKPDFQKFLEGK